MAAEFVCTSVEKWVAERDTVTLALAGGKTPKVLYQNLAQPPFDKRMPWSRIHFFWGDERCVSRDHPDSNFGMAFRAMICRAPVHSQNIHPAPTEISPSEKAAEAYEKHLREFFGWSVKGDGRQATVAERSRFPTFDLILLGIGKDGHTASLFPGDKARKEKRRWVAAVDKPRGSPAVPRVTLTLPVINRAKCVLFLVSGAEKRDVVQSIIKDPETARCLYPAAMVQPEGRTLWMLDEGAAGRDPKPDSSPSLSD
jgi:6-phosphogluconolactonase